MSVNLFTYISNLKYNKEKNRLLKEEKVLLPQYNFNSKYLRPMNSIKRITSFICAKVKSN